jgi:outer membrane protein OmpA-like peptidoglycan-associated protein
LVATRIDKQIDLYWNNTPPVKGMDPHECSIRWTGRLKAPQTGTYKFSARVDDGIRVWVGNEKVIDDWQLNDVGIFSGEVKMEAGKFYDLKVEYFNALVEGEITLLWHIPEEDESWFDSWFADNAEVIGPEFYFQPKESIAVRMEEPPVREEKKVNESRPPAVRQSPASAPSKKPTPKPASPKEEVATAVTIQKYIPETIQFERAKTDILPESFPDLDELANFLLRHPNLKVTVEGHTDYVGDAYKNVILSQDRADAVAAYLLEKGVREDRISAKGYGGLRPLAKNDGRKYHPENRRVAFIIE